MLIDTFKCFEALMFLYSLWLKRGNNGRRGNSKNPQATLNTSVKFHTNKNHAFSTTKNKGVWHKRMANQARESTEGRRTETLAKILGSSHHGTRSTNQASGNKPDLSKGQ
jgi:hypothetical protein